MMVVRRRIKMRRPIVRLSSLQLTSIKNVKKGTIYMPNTVNKILLGRNTGNLRTKWFGKNSGC